MEQDLRFTELEGRRIAYASVGEGPLLTDDKPAIEYFASLPQDERALTRIGRDPTALIRP